MRIQFRVQIEDHTTDLPSLWTEPNEEPEIVHITYREAALATNPNFQGKEAREVNVLLDFVKSPQFIECVNSLRPTAPIEMLLNFTKNSDGDDPPDFTLELPGSPSIGIELTDCSPISACVAKISSHIDGGSQIPGVSDAQSYHEIEEFMRKPVSLVSPHFTDLGREGEKMDAYLERQIRSKDVPGNEVLILASWMGDWPDSEFAGRVKASIKPKHIQRIVLVSQTRSTFI